MKKKDVCCGSQQSENLRVWWRCDAMRFSVALLSRLTLGLIAQGSFGTALAFKLAKNERHSVVIVARNAAVVEAINTTRRNPQYLGSAKYTMPGASQSSFFARAACRRFFTRSRLDSTTANVSATSDFASALSDVNYIVHTVPVQSSFDYLREVAKYIPKVRRVCLLLFFSVVVLIRRKKTDVSDRERIKGLAQRNARVHERHYSQGAQQSVAADGFHLGSLVCQRARRRRADRRRRRCVLISSCMHSSCMNSSCRFGSIGCSFLCVSVDRQGRSRTRASVVPSHVFARLHVERRRRRRGWRRAQERFCHRCVGFRRKENQN